MISRTIVSTCALVALACGLSAPVTAYFADHHTRFTFSQPVTIPGVTLPAGTYTFRMVDPTGGSRVVQVLDANARRSYTMFMSIPATRQDIARKPEVSFMETAAGMPVAVKIWWPEGSSLGHEFIYSKEQIQRLTKGAAPIPESTVADARFSAGADSEDAVQSSAPATSTGPAVEERIDAARSSQAAEQQGQSAQSAPVAAQESTAAPSQDQGAREELPQTASLFPLIVFLGTLSLLGGVWLRRKTHA